MKSVYLKLLKYVHVLEVNDKRCRRRQRVGVLGVILYASNQSLGSKLALDIL